jgi:uncharacterized membrane protein
METLFSALAAAMMLAAGIHRFLKARPKSRKAAGGDRSLWVTLGMMAIAFALLIVGQVLSNDR